MAKPICIVKVDNAKMQFTEIFKIQELLDKRLTDYHVLVVPFQQPEGEYNEPMQVQVFHEKDFTEIQYQELKQIVYGSVNAIPLNGG